MFIRSVSTIVFLALVMVGNTSFASSKSWNQLQGIEKYLLNEHKASWNGYDQAKKSQLIRSIASRVKKYNRYKKWMDKNLTKTERMQCRRNFKKMSKKNFKKYMDGLFKKYGHP